MSITISSTTPGVTQEEMERVVSDPSWGADAEWRKPPPAKPEPEAQKSEPSVKEFIEAREEELREKRNDGEQRYRHKGGGQQKRIDRLTKEKFAERAARIAAERELAELKARPNGTAAPGPTQTPAAQNPTGESAPSNASQSKTPEQTNGAAQNADVKAKSARIEAELEAKLPDYREVMKAAKRIQIPTALAEKITHADNFEEVRYFLAKNPAIIKELEEGRVTVGQISADLKKATNAPAPAQNHPAIQRWQALGQDHVKRVQALVKTLPDAHTLKTPSVPLPVEIAIIEQGAKSHEIEIHLARNPALVSELQKMTIPAAVAKIGRIAEQLEKATPKVKPPEPITPVGGSASRSGQTLEDMDLKSFMKVRNKQEREHRGR